MTRAAILLPQYTTNPLDEFTVDADRIAYTEENHQTWAEMYGEVTSASRSYASRDCVHGFEWLQLPTARVPRVGEISAALEGVGWRAVGVDGLISPKAFFWALSNRLLPISVLMRSRESKSYSPVPDLIHEVLGHACLLHVPDYRDCLQRLGRVGVRLKPLDSEVNVFKAMREECVLRASPDGDPLRLQELEAVIQRETAKTQGMCTQYQAISRLVWWTIEIGLIKDEAANQAKIFGAALLSSPKESKNSLAAESTQIPFGLQSAINAEFDPTEMQQQFFVIDSWRQLNEASKDFEALLLAKSSALDS